MHKAINQCRVCGNTNLISILDLGRQALTGVFPKPNESVDRGPVELVKCHGEGACGLVQLKHTYDLTKMYGDNYGYRSGLNKSMVKHLEGIAVTAIRESNIDEGGVILDIGSNDGTLLSLYKTAPFYQGGEPYSYLDNVTFVGMDPTISKFENYYADHIVKIPDFFSSKRFKEHFNDSNRKASIVTSIACFYDLEDPVAFAKDVAEILHKNGVWIFEQSYSLMMLVKNMYDTVVQEHLEYYSLSQIKRIVEEAGLYIDKVELNDCNGGSFRVIAKHADSSLKGVCDLFDRDYRRSESVDLLLTQEKILGLDSLYIYRDFSDNALNHRYRMQDLFKEIHRSGKTVAGLGASTKFNAVLQYCQITPNMLPKIGEVNPDKFGRTTPGTKIPIVSEKEVLAEKPDYLMVGPYHFKEFLLSLPHVQKYLDEGGTLIFPLPDIEMVNKNGTYGY